MAAQCRRFAPTFDHQRNYRAQAVIPANNRRRSNRTSAGGTAKVKPVVLLPRPWRTRASVGLTSAGCWPGRRSSRRFGRCC